jgi:hypothetical protein
VRHHADSQGPAPAALRGDRIEAPWVLDSPIDGESFTIHVEKILLPTLKPGDIVIMDNLGSHKERELIRSVDAKLFLLPKYSPDLTRSNRSSPSSSTCCASRRANDRGRLSSDRSAALSLEDAGLNLNSFRSPMPHRRHRF